MLEGGAQFSAALQKWALGHLSPRLRYFWAGGLTYSEGPHRHLPPAARALGVLCVFIQ